jgi:hypothetical protein
MGLRQTVEENIVVFFVGTLVAGFIAGWSALSGLQAATGHTAISIDRLKELEGPAAQEKKGLLEKIGDLEMERASLLQRLKTNRPSTGNYVLDLVLSPPSPASLRVGDHITVRFLYVLNKGEEASIWATADGPVEYYGASPVTGSGTDERELKGQRPGKVKEVEITMGTPDGETLYVMKFPVDYTFN